MTRPSDPSHSGSPQANARRPPRSLQAWQARACDAWEAGDEVGPNRGTLEIFTGGGKSLIALECLRRAQSASPGLRAMIVVPTLALARQWQRVVLENTELTDSQIGALDGEHKDTLDDKSVLITVLNSAAEHLPRISEQTNRPLMLIVDECHRAGAPKFSRVLRTRAEYRLGLSATAEREDVDEDGTLIAYDEHILGQRLGAIVFRFDLRNAREIGWLPDFTVHHHAVQLTDAERRKYEELTRRVDDLLDRLQDAGIESSRARQTIGQPGEIGAVARAFVGAVALRKDLLYRASERTRVVSSLMRSVADRTPQPRVLLFHERIDEAIQLHEELTSAQLGLIVGIEHSRMSESARRRSLDEFAAGTTPVLVSVKALVEGIDVPDADIGFSVASSSSVRQRVQSLGRVLRRRFDGGQKVAEMHLIYVAETVDEAIYGKQDWSDLTGEAANRYLTWPLGDSEPTPLPGPPMQPRPTEEQVLASLPDVTGTLTEPIEWTADWPSAEWRLDSRGNLTDLKGQLVVNPQGTVAAVQRIKPTGGRLRVSRRGSVVVPDMSGDSPRAWLVARLEEPFSIATDDRNPTQSSASAHHQTFDIEERASNNKEPSELSQGPSNAATDTAVALGSDPEPGGHHTGPTDRTLGTFRIRQKGGGVIERRTSKGREFAGSHEGEGPSDLVSNAQKVLRAWLSTGEAGLSFHVNGEGTAFFVSNGQARFLARVPGGFAWPSEEPK